jgi:hypothetical protein
LLVAGAALLSVAPAALAGSGSLKVTDAGDGSMSVTINATVDSCRGSFCGWFAAVRERHSTLPCSDDRVFRPAVGGFHLQPATVEETLAFRPFFPRSAKLCLYAKSPFGLTDLLDEVTYKVPSGYGFRHSKTRRCPDFDSQAAAQYYLYLYPDDPSGLDPERNGLACDENPCPCEAELIPPEPPESRELCTKAQAKKRQATRAVKVAERRLRKAERAIAARRWNRTLKKRKATLRKAKRRVRKACRPLA